MHPVIEQIKTLYGDACRLCPPLDAAQYDAARAFLPAALFEMLKVCNGIEELMSLPNVDDGEPFSVYWILESLEGMQSFTQEFSELFSEEGTVFAGDGAGGFYVLKPDGAVYYYECPGEEGDCIAENLAAFYTKKH